MDSQKHDPAQYDPAQHDGPPAPRPFLEDAPAADALTGAAPAGTEPIGAAPAGAAPAEGVRVEAAASADTEALSDDATDDGADDTDERRSRVPLEAALGVGAQVEALRIATTDASPERVGHDPREIAPQPADPAVATAGPSAAKSGIFASTAAKVITGIVAVALVGAGAVTWAALSHVAGSDSAASVSATDSDPGDSGENSGADAAITFDPSVVLLDTQSDILQTTDASGREVTLVVPVPSVKATGVDPEIASAFANTVPSAYSAAVDTRLQQYADVTLAECGDTQLDAASTAACAREAMLTVEQAGVYEQYGTVA